MSLKLILDVAKVIVITKCKSHCVKYLLW